jgi:hypothetical protein
LFKTSLAIAVCGVLAAPLVSAAGNTFGADATDRKLAGAARDTFMAKCHREAAASARVGCDAQASDRQLSGAAKTSFTNRCVIDAAGLEASCDDRAAHKKLSGAARTASAKKCVSDSLK